LLISYGIFTVILKPSFYYSLFLCSHLTFLRLIWNLTTRYLAVTGGGSIGWSAKEASPAGLGAL